MLYKEMDQTVASIDQEAPLGQDEEFAIMDDLE